MSYILLIEDDLALAGMVQRLLEVAGYQVKHVPHGFDGAKLARANVPSLILMDFNLPDIDGRTLAFTLHKQLWNDAAPPIIACTSHTGRSEARLAERFGCAAFLGKPFSPQELLEIVERFVPCPNPHKLL